MHHGQGGFQPLDGGAAPGPAEVIGRQGCEQIEPHVGGGGAMCDDLVGGLLEVVRWQLVIEIGHEGFKIAPGAARNQPQLHRLLCVARHLFREIARLAAPAGQQGSQQPEQAEGHDQRPGAGRRAH